MEEIKEFSNSYVENQRKGFISAILCRLNVKDRLFVREYVKDFAPRRAAEASGFTPDDGNKLIEKPIIKLAIDDIVDYISDNTGIDAEWIMTELADNHRIARQQGNIGASNTSLKLLMQHVNVDAMATQRTEVGVIGLDETTERMQRGRNRLAEAKQVHQLPPKKVTSFL